jgi:hypothetical protein
MEAEPWSTFPAFSNYDNTDAGLYSWAVCAYTRMLTTIGAIWELFLASNHVTNFMSAPLFPKPSVNVPMGTFRLTVLVLFLSSTYYREYIALVYGHTSLNVPDLGSSPGSSLVSTWMGEYAVLLFLCLAYLTQYDVLQFHSFCCRWQDFIFIWLNSNTPLYI